MSDTETQEKPFSLGHGKTGRFQFDDRFLEDHAGRIVTDPRIAIVELVANAYDAGAKKVDIYWPEKIGEPFTITDDGIGMTRYEFEDRWHSISYDRIKKQGNEVIFPPGVTGIKRTPFGQSGKGRFAPFCFSDSYTVTTRKEGKGTRANVVVTTTNSPFDLENVEEFTSDGSGTIISAIVERSKMKVDDVIKLIGSKFLIDPSISIYVNGTMIQLLDLEGVVSEVIPVEPYGEIIVHFLDTSEHSRTNKLRGITWWVNRRMVGEPSWRNLDEEGSYLDGRTEEAKRYSFIVEADFLKPKVKGDWKDFYSEKMTDDVKKSAHHFVVNKLHELLSGNKKHRKIEALISCRKTLGELPTISKKVVSQFLGEVLEKCRSISDRDLQITAQILVKLEESRWQYDLLKTLSECNTDDLDKWAVILKQWSASSAELILGELQRRLRLIERMQQVVEDPTADELHQLQPLFERGLWIFGTEYEAVDYRSNRGLREVIHKFLGMQQGSGDVNGDYEYPIERIDLIATADRSINAYSADSYNNGNISGIRKVLIIELKKGGFKLTQEDVNQALEYAKQVKRSGRVQKETHMEVVVLGAHREDDLEELEVKSSRIVITPLIYDTILQQARLRTFNLERKLKEIEPIQKDPDVEKVFKDTPLLAN